MSPFTIIVDYSNVYGAGPRLSKNFIEVNVTPDTTIDKVKSTVLNYLNIPYPDLYYLEFNKQKLDDKSSIGLLNFSKKRVLVLRCSNLDELYSRLRRDGRI
ncbi:MAG: ubiquitin family protein [Nitrososphaeria archaeon]|nr:ubiquitin family protein [Nitrososphaeria archaeon]